MANGAPTVSNGLVISGVTTSTTFSGSGASLTNIPSAQLTGALPALDGSNLTGLSGVSVANQSDNRLITATGTTDALNGEANLTFDGSSLDIFNGSNSSTIKLKRHASTASEQAHIGYFSSGLHIETRESTYISLKTNTQERLRIGTNGALSINYAGDGDNTLHIGCTSNAGGIILKAPGNHYANIVTDCNRSGANNGILNLAGRWNGNDVAYISFTTGTDTTNKDDGYIRMYTRESGQSLTERLRITTAGRIGVNEGSPNATLHIKSADGANNRLELVHQNDAANEQNQITFKNNTTQTAYIVSGKDGSNNNIGLSFGTGTTERLRISSDGIVTMPNQPAFRAYISGGPQSINGTIPFSQIDYNIGSNFNSSNYRFTAPVAGRYQFNFYSIYRGNITNGHFGFYINGGGFNGDRAHFTHQNLGNAWDYIDMSQVLNLSAGDYVTALTHSAVDLHGGNWAAFSGHLVG